MEKEKSLRFLLAAAVHRRAERALETRAAWATPWLVRFGLSFFAIGFLLTFSHSVPRWGSGECCEAQLIQARPPVATVQKRQVACHCGSNVG